MTNQTDILELIAQGESITLEFKTCEKKLNKDVYDTVCAFLNRHGGIILLGVTDDGEVQGIDSQYISQIRKDFVTTINNGQKIYPPAYATIQELQIGDKHILRIDVQESPDVHRRDNFSLIEMKMVTSISPSKTSKWPISLPEKVKNIPRMKSSHMCSC